MSNSAMTCHLAVPCSIAILFCVVSLLPLNLPAQEPDTDVDASSSRAGHLLGEGKAKFWEGERSSFDEPAQAVATRFRDAVSLLEQAVALDSTNQEALYFLGYAYDRASTWVSSGNSIPSTALEDVLRVSGSMERVLAIDPVYRGDVIALSPASKITSEWGSLAASYTLRGRRDSALWAFNEGRSRGGFNDAVLDYCRNILRSCDTNALLLVNGDNDTFPIWYLQRVENYRRDVTALNVSLCNTSWYVRMMRDGDPFGTGALQLNIPNAQLDTLSAQLLTSPVPVMVYLSGDGARRGNPESVRLAVPGREGDGFHFLQIADRVLLDALTANHGRRPLFIANTVDTEVATWLGLDKNLVRCGFASRAVARSASEFRIYTDVLYRRLTDEVSGFRWSSSGRQAAVTDRDALPWLRDAASIFIQTALELRQTNQRARTSRVLTRMREMLPLQRMPEILDGTLGDEYNRLLNYAGMKRAPNDGGN